MHMKLINPDKSLSEIYTHLLSEPGIHREIKRYKCFVLTWILRALDNGSLIPEPFAYTREQMEDEISRCNKCK